MNIAIALRYMEMGNPEAVRNVRRMCAEEHVMFENFLRRCEEGRA